MKQKRASMHDAATGLADYLRTVHLQTPRIPLYANCTAQPYGSNAAELLAR